MMNYKLKKQVFRFDISMNKPLAVNIPNSLHCLSDVLLHIWFLQTMMLLQLTIEMALSRIFRHEVERFLVVEETVEIDNILMFQTVVNANLFGHLVLYLFFPDDCFGDYFEGA